MKDNRVNKQKRVGILGHFGFGHNLYNGQVIKTKTIYNSLLNTIGKDEIVYKDTHGRFKRFLVAFQTISLLRRCKNVIVMPGPKGVKVIIPLLFFLNKFYKRKTHYVVIGGWINTLATNNPKVLKHLAKFDCIYVETKSLDAFLKSNGLNNSIYFPNFKEIKPVTGDELTEFNSNKKRLCTFSRVMKEKGIETAVDAVIKLNENKSNIQYELDIFGEVDKNQKEWFTSLLSRLPSYIRYKGIINPNESVSVLKSYDALLFPTYYKGEGFPGTLIDAMFAGVPIVASDWKYNSEIVNSNNGLLFPIHDIDALTKCIREINIPRISCLNEAKKYSSETIIKELINRL